MSTSSAPSIVNDVSASTTTSRVHHPSTSTPVAQHPPTSPTTSQFMSNIDQQLQQGFVTVINDINISPALLKLLLHLNPFQNNCIKILDTWRMYTIFDYVAFYTLLKQQTATFNEHYIKCCGGDQFKSEAMIIALRMGHTFYCYLKSFYKIKAYDSLPQNLIPNTVALSEEWIAGGILENFLKHYNYQH